MFFVIMVFLTRKIILFKKISKMFLLLRVLQEYGIICRMLFLRKAQKISASEKNIFRYFII